MGTFEDEQWEESLQAVQICSVNVAQRLSQIYILYSECTSHPTDCSGWE